MKRAVSRVEPLGVIDMLRAWQALRDDPGEGRRFVVEHRSQLEAHAAGAPARYGHDVQQLARTLLRSA